jgi:hypothetical protein
VQASEGARSSTSDERGQQDGPLPESGHDRTHRFRHPSGQSRESRWAIEVFGPIIGQDHRLCPAATSGRPEHAAAGSAIDAGFKDITLAAQEVTDGSVEFGRFTMVGPTTGGIAGTMAGKYAVLWRDDGGWHIHRDIRNDDPVRFAG